jgi:hypothetical protein
MDDVLYTSKIIQGVDNWIPIAIGIEIYLIMDHTLITSVTSIYPVPALSFEMNPVRIGPTFWRSMLC